MRGVSRAAYVYFKCAPSQLTSGSLEFSGMADGAVSLFVVKGGVCGRVVEVLAKAANSAKSRGSGGPLTAPANGAVRLRRAKRVAKKGVFVTLETAVKFVNI